jgi:hypothetical protein
MINRWKAPVKVFSRQIGTMLKRLLILRRYKQAARQQRSAEAQMSPPHIRHFGLKAKPRFAPDM